MSTTTPNFGLIKPGVADPTDQDLWGGYLNSDLDVIDTQLKIAQSPTVNPQTTDYTALTTDQNKYITVDATSGNLTITLLAAATATNGFKIGVKKIDASINTVTIDGNASETIDGDLNKVLTERWDCISLLCNGTTWFVIAEVFDETVPLATNADSNAGTSTVVALTPGNFGTQNTLSMNGYQKLPGGLILQWGQQALGVEPDTQTVTFPIAFTTAVYSVTTTTQRPTGTYDNGNFVQMYGSPTLTTFQVINQQVVTGNIAITCHWIAIGK